MKRLRLVLGADAHAVDVVDSGPADGPVFLLLHGVGLSHRPYLRLAEQLAPHGRVIALDLPGFGSTPTPDRSIPVEEYARLIVQALATLEVTACVAIGHSMGAQFALALALEQPELVSHVVLIGPVTDSAHPSAARQMLVLARDSLLEPPLTNALVFSDYVRTGPRWYFTEVAAMLAYPTHERIGSLTAPLLIIRGGHDPIATTEWCERLLRLAGGGTLHVIDRHRHVVAHTAADRVAHAIVGHAVTAPAPSDAPR